MMKRYRIIGMVCLTVAAITADAQTAKRAGINPEDRQVDMDNPTFVPMVKVGKVLLGRDSVQYVELNNIYVYPKPVFKNERQMMAYNRLVYNVKKVLPRNVVASSSRPMTICRHCPTRKRATAT